MRPPFPSHRPPGFETLWPVHRSNVRSRAFGGSQSNPGREQGLCGEVTCLQAAMCGYRTKTTMVLLAKRSEQSGRNTGDPQLQLSGPLQATPPSTEGLWLVKWGVQTKSGGGCKVGTDLERATDAQDHRFLCVDLTAAIPENSVVSSERDFPN